MPPSARRCASTCSADTPSPATRRRGSTRSPTRWSRVQFRLIRSVKHETLCCTRKRGNESRPEALMRLEDVVTTDPEIMGGTPVFTGTRVPAESLIQHLSAGDSLDDFLEG